MTTETEARKEREDLRHWLDVLVDARDALQGAQRYYEVSEEERTALYAVETVISQYRARIHDLGITRCESGWTGDRCYFRLGHEGPHSND